MALLSVDQLLAPLTRDQFKAKIYELAAALGLSTTSWFSGAPTRVLIAILAEIYGAFVAPLIVVITKSGFLDDAEGGWLTLLCRTHFGVERRVATFASDTLKLTNTGGGLFDFAIGEAVFKNAATDALYTNQEPISLNGVGTQTISIRAMVIGSAGNATAGQITEIVTTMPDVTCTNENDLTGQDEESDVDLRQRARDRLSALSPNGPAQAYRYVALTPELNGGANINRVKVKPAVGDSSLEVLLASPTGEPSPADIDLVQAGFDEWATPDGTLTIAEGASEFAWNTTVTAHVNAAAGMTDDEWEDLIKAELVSWIGTLPIEGVILPPATSGVVPYRTAIGIVERARPEGVTAYHVLHASLAVEADAPVPLGAVATLDLGSATVNITQVNQL